MPLFKCLVTIMAKNAENLNDLASKCIHWKYFQIFFLADSLKTGKCIQDAECDVAVNLCQYNFQIKILKQMVFPREQMFECSDGDQFKNIGTMKCSFCSSLL